MKNTKNTTIKKLLLSLILVVMLGNFIMPNYVQADDGGKLAKPIFEFVAWVGDVVIGFLQRTLGNGGDIKNINGQFDISYTPGNIFANNIAMFDVNFVKPNKYSSVSEDGWTYIKKVTQVFSFNSDSIVEWIGLKNDYGWSEDKEVSDSPKLIVNGEVYDTYDEVKTKFQGHEDGVTVIISHRYQWNHNGKEYLYVQEASGLLENLDGTLSWSPRNGRLYEKNTVNVESIATTLQPHIATWYKALRTLALVGLLSVLVYIGIRIIISSSSDDKAKYKKMLAGWVSAICIVFVLHYIMVFILSLSEQLIEIFKSQMQSGTGTDNIMSSIRRQMGDTTDFINIASETICYVALVILTCIFTIQYLKRVVYMAFLTIVAPLIALTYPLDKIKDGKAQAFSMWLKEYIFNALLQPIHLLLYIIFVGSFASGTFLTENPLYAIVAIAFLVPAEKFFRKMFGMESQTSVGTIGAAAGGAMVMSMLSKMKGKPPKDEAEKAPKVRTADQNVGGGAPRQMPGPNGPVPNAPGPNGPVPNAPGPNGPVPNAPDPNAPVPPPAPPAPAPGPNAPDPNAPVPPPAPPAPAPGPNAPGPNGPGPNAPGPARRQVRVPTRPQKFWRATKAVAGHVGDKYIYGKEGRRRLRRTIIGAAGGLAAGTIGLAAGVATGDLGNAFKYAGAGAAAGYVGAANLGENINSKVHSAIDTARKGYMGTEAYNNAQFDKQFFKSDEYKIMEEKYGKDIKQDVQGYLSKGVTDTKEMEKMIKNGITATEYGNFKDNGLKDVAKMAELAKEGVSAEEYGALADEGITDVYKIKKIKEYNKKYKQRTGRNLSSKELAERMKVAKQIPKNAKDDPTEFKNFVRTRLGKGWSDSDIQELYDSLYDLI